MGLIFNYVLLISLLFWCSIKLNPYVFKRQTLLFCPARLPTQKSQKVRRRWIWTVQKVTVVLSTSLKNSEVPAQRLFSQLWRNWWMCGSSVPARMQQLRDQPVSLTGMCAAECWPVHWTEPQISGAGWPTGCSLWLCRQLVGSSLCMRHLSR